MISFDSEGMRADPEYRRLMARYRLAQRAATVRNPALDQVLREQDALLTAMGDIARRYGWTEDDR